MDQELRTSKGLQDRINKLQADLIRRFSKLIDLADITRVDPKTRISFEAVDRAATAVVQYQIQAETAGMIRAAEEVQTLIRQMQEMWLFGQLSTLGENRVRRETDENARVVADLLEQLTTRQAAVGEGADQ